MKDDGLIEDITGQRPQRRSPMGGGCIADVERLEMPDGRRLVAKWGGHGSGLELEGRMLVDLKEGGLAVPDVLYYDDSLLLMTYLESSGGLTRKAQAEAADAVAALHNTRGPFFGYHYDTVIGGLPQPNPRYDRWVPFFAEMRLIDRARRALDDGRMPRRLMDRVEAFAGKVDRWIGEPEHPSLIHGDMWTGNVLCRDGHLAGFIDPAVYFAHPEIELAFSTLFGTFGEPFFERYQQHRRLEPGFFEERRDIYNLYPLLVHVHLFGGGYVGSVERILGRFGF